MLSVRRTGLIIRYRYVPDGTDLVGYQANLKIGYQAGFSVPYFKDFQKMKLTKKRFD
jgi:hypothetical protein